VIYHQKSPLGPVFVVVSRFRLPRVRSPIRPPGNRENPPPFRPDFDHGPPGGVLEIGIYLDRVSRAFGLLEHNLIIGSLAALALVASMILIALLLKRYARTREIERQLELAEGVQRDLLPRPDLFSAVASQFAAVSIPAATVGGDFHDVLQGEGGRLSLVLGDVSGKGLSAALLMGVIHGAVRSTDWTSSSQRHETATQRLNQLLCEKTAHERFASLFWCCFDPQLARLRYVNAGHLPPLLVHARQPGCPIDRLNEGGGPVLGLLPLAQFESTEIPIHPGDLLVIYSDGILEALNAQDEEFGEDRIARFVREASHASPGQVCDTVLAAIKDFLGPLKPHDDQTLMVVRLIPIPPNLSGEFFATPSPEFSHAIT
jgi:sigma-B regulation protein RsbU (phosphoserine phosphatase)